MRRSSSSILVRKHLHAAAHGCAHPNSKSVESPAAKGLLSLSGGLSHEPCSSSVTRCSNSPVASRTTHITPLLSACHSMLIVLFVRSACRAQGGRARNAQHRHCMPAQCSHVQQVSFSSCDCDQECKRNRHTSRFAKAPMDFVAGSLPICMPF